MPEKEQSNSRFTDPTPFTPMSELPPEGQFFHRNAVRIMDKIRSLSSYETYVEGITEAKNLKMSDGVTPNPMYPDDYEPMPREEWQAQVDRIKSNSSAARRADQSQEA